MLTAHQLLATARLPFNIKLNKLFYFLNNFNFDNITKMKDSFSGQTRSLTVSRIGQFEKKEFEFEIVNNLILSRVLLNRKMNLVKV